MLPIIEIPRRRKFLAVGIGARVRELFGRDQSRPLPRVRFFGPDEARRERRPTTSFYDFRTGSIGLYYDTALDVDTLWATLAWHSLHENLHWALNFSPAQSGARDRTDCSLLNIVADAANEQRAGLASEWCRDLLRRGRRTVLERELAAALPESPLWAAAWLSLRVHTFLAARGWRIIARGADERSGVTADAVWAAVEPEVGLAPAHIADRWPEAWRQVWSAWRADNQHTVVEAVRRLRELFPESEGDPAPASSPGAADDHLGTDAPRPDTPPAAEGLAAPAAPARCDCEPAPEVDECEPASGEPAPRPEATPEDLRADLDDAAEEDQTDEPIGAEVAELLEDPRMWAPLARVRPRLKTLRDYITATSGARLLAAAEAPGAELARKIEAIRTPSVRRESTRGRVRARLVALDPAHPRPFRERERHERSLAPGVFVGVMLDTSGSMSLPGRIDAAREAAMAVTLACDATRTATVTVTSRGLIHVAGDRMPQHRAAALLSGISPSGDEGFPVSLAPFLDEVSRRREQVRVVVIVMDGMPVGADTLTPIIRSYRAHGLAVVGLGLDLNRHEGEGLERLFGVDAVLATRARFAASLATTVSAAIARGVR